MKASTIGFNSDYHEEVPTLEELQAYEDYAFLEFGAPWCGHCQAAAPSIEAVLSEQKHLHIKVFDGKGKLLGRQFGVKLWPTLILVKAGQELGRVVRPRDTQAIEELVNLIE